MTSKAVMNNSSRIIGDIEVLRAVAILFTLFAHLGALFAWGNSYYQKATSHLAFWGGGGSVFCHFRICNCTSLAA